MTSRRGALRNLVDELSGEAGAPFTIGQAQAAGLTARDLRTLAAQGLLAAPQHGVRTPSCSDDLLGRVQVAQLLLPPGAAIGRRTAAELLGIDPRLPAERYADLDVETLVPAGRVPIRRPGIRSFATDLLASDIRGMHGIPVTTAARTAADLLRWLPPQMALAVADAMARRDLIAVDQVRAILDRWDGHRFIDRARRLLAIVDPKAESYGESWQRLRISDAGFPPPQSQIPVLDAAGREVYRLDLGWPEVKVGAEYDGEEFHSAAHDVEHDRRRREDLFTRYGWNVVGCGKAEILGPSMRFERGLGEMLGVEPAITRRCW